MGGRGFILRRGPHFLGCLWPCSCRKGALLDMAVSLWDCGPHHVGLCASSWGAIRPLMRGCVSFMSSCGAVRPSCCLQPGAASVLLFPWDPGLCSVLVPPLSEVFSEVRGGNCELKAAAVQTGPSSQGFPRTFSSRQASQPTVSEN